jgi:hypothetical protein
MPEQTPIPTKAPERTVDPEREHPVDPEKLCPAQKTTITRTISPFLP